MGNFIEVEENGVKFLLNLNAVEYIHMPEELGHRESIAVMLNGNRHIILGTYRSFVDALSLKQTD